MTQVNFHSGVPDRLGYVCRLLRKAQQSGARIGVTGPAPLLNRLDAALWTFEPGEFVPHLRFLSGALPAGALGQTPVLLTEAAADLPHRELLLNLGRDVPEGFEQFERLFEVVSLDEEQVQAGRQRYKHYQQAGHVVIHHPAAA